MPPAVAKPAAAGALWRVEETVETVVGEWQDHARRGEQAGFLGRR